MLFVGVRGGSDLGIDFVTAISVVCQTIAIYSGMLTASNYIHRHLLRSVLRWPVTTFDRIPSGRIMNRFGFDIDVLDNLFPNNVMQLLNQSALVSWCVRS